MYAHDARYSSLKESECVLSTRATSPNSSSAYAHLKEPRKPRSLTHRKRTQRKHL